MKRRPVALALLVLASACGPAEEPGPPPATETAAEVRVPVQPTAPDALPAAIVGEAGELRGQPLQYLDGDTPGALAAPTAGTGRRLM